jgi:hypothetical protein
MYARTGVLGKETRSRQQISTFDHVMRGKGLPHNVWQVRGSSGRMEPLSASGGGEMAFAMVNLIRQARDTRGWTSAKLNAEIRRAAQRAGVSTASTSSLRVLISCWENDRQKPDATYQMLLQTVFDLPAAALGFDNNSAGPEGDGLQPLVERGSKLLAASSDVLGYYSRQLLEQARLDNAAGPGLLLDVVQCQVNQLRGIATHGPAEAVELAARFLEHAGWLHQDSGNLEKALAYTDEAVDLADHAGNAALTAYNMMRKSNVLTARGDRQRAVVTAAPCSEPRGATGSRARGRVLATGSVVRSPSAKRSCCSSLARAGAGPGCG